MSTDVHKKNARCMSTDTPSMAPSETRSHVNARMQVTEHNLAARSE